MQIAKVERLIHGALVREGAGVKLQRYVGTDKTNALEPILLFDYFNSTDLLDYMAGFPQHPHRGFETITYLLQGHITHEDNKGHKGVIGPGDVQWMTAGKGIVHSEMPAAEQGHLQGVQLWLNLPAAQKMREPRYQELSGQQLPIEQQESGVRIKVLAGATDKGTRSPIKDIATNPLFFDIHLPKGTRFSQQVPVDYQTLLFVVSGGVHVDEQYIESNVLAVLSADKNVVVRAEEDSECFLISAAKLNEPIVRHGPFVMNTEEEIKQAVNDFHRGLF
jgi:redox-sensitive bicupin YhaK (pirin superfamily)